MKKLVLLCAVATLMLTGACGPKDKYFGQYWVTTGEANVLKSPKLTSEAIGKMKFGEEFTGRIENQGPFIPKELMQIKYGQGIGYIERGKIGDEAKIDAMKELMDSAKESQVQITGVTTKKTPFRMGPSRDSVLIEYMKDPANVEMFDRMIVTKETKSGPKKEVWYKVRLEDGRVGYVYTSNVKFTTPREISQYTDVRKPVSWHLLRERTDEATGEKRRDYLVSYMSLEAQGDVDYTRIELYTPDLKTGAYSTQLANSTLNGILPIIIRDEGDGKKIIELRELAKGKPDKLRVTEYSFPNPIKIVKQYEIDKQK